MSDYYGSTGQGTAWEDPYAPPKKSNKKYWIIAGCGCLSIICLVLVAALLIYFWPSISLLLGGEPTASRTPSNAMAYFGVDLLNAQSDDVTKIANVFQDITGSTQGDLITTLDDSFNESYGMTFTDSVIPWVGRYAAFVITDMDVNSGDVGYMAIIQSRDNGKADQFIQDLVAALEDRDGASFNQSKTNGITFYTDPADYSYETDTVLARAGNFVYISTSESAILNSVDLSKSASLAGNGIYKQTIAALPKDRLATMYVTGDAYASILSSSMGYTDIPANYLELLKFGGMGMSVSVVDKGLEMDVAIAYDENTISDFQKETLQATFRPPSADALVPGDTFFFFGTNSSQSPSRFLESGSPLYTQEVRDALDLLNADYGVDLKELLGYLTGEVALAVAPSYDSVLATQGEVNIGLMFLAGTNNEGGVVNWANYALDSLAADSYTTFNTSNLNIGPFNLTEVEVDDYYSGTISIGAYGSGNGYFVLGSGDDMLRTGLEGSNSLANNSTYKDTWRAFASGSVPYLYLDTAGLLRAMETQVDPYSMSELNTAVAKIPTIAMTMNNPRGLTQSLSLIVFINYK